MLRRNPSRMLRRNNGSPTPSSDPVVKSLSHFLTPFEDSDFLLEKTDAFLYLDDSMPSGIDNGIYDSEGDILFLEELLNDDPTPDLLPHLLVFEINETEKIKTLIKDPPNLELKDLPPHLEYAFLEGTSKLPVIIAKDLREEEKEQLLKVLKSHKRVIAWKISDIRGIDPNFCTYKILIEDDFKLVVQYHRRVNPKIHEVIKAEVIKRLDAGLIYPISDSPWEKTTFTCPYGTFAYRRMPFGLCNALGTFQRCMVAIFHDMIEKTMEVFMDHFLVFMDSFSSCLSHLDMMLKRCEDTNLVLNWEKCHFMVKEGIILGHKISKNGIEVDRAKVDMISKLPSPTTEFNIEIRNKKEAENLTADNLSRLENPHQGDRVGMEINDNFPHETMNMISLNTDNEPLWFIDIANYLVGNVLVKWMSSQQKKKFFKDEALDILQACYHGPTRDIMAQTTPPRKFLTLVFSGSPYIVMPMTLSHTHGLDFMGPFPSSQGNRYILVVVDYLSKWVEAKALPTNDARVVVKFLKQLFSRFGTPRVIISDRAGIRKSLSSAHRARAQSLLALKWANFDLKITGDPRKVQMNELNELRDQAYENSLIYKEKTKKIHDAKIKNREFHVGDHVLLFNSRLKIFSGKLKSRWSGPFLVAEVFPCGTIELSQPDGPNFKVNRHRIKHYYGGDIPAIDVPDLHLSPKDN
ncbi:reverse transcriptase domain-containing protein [Tanacetum coccineum]